MNKEQRKQRKCDYCGLFTTEAYTDKEWEAAGHECDECLDAELVDGTIDD